MKKLLLTLAALPAATMAVEASAQTYVNTQAATGIDTRIANLEARYQAALNARVLTGSEAQTIRNNLLNLRSLRDRYAYNGITAAERRQLQAQIRVTRDQLRRAGGTGWANRYGWTDRDLDVYANTYRNTYGQVTYDQYGRPIQQGYYGQGGPYQPVYPQQQSGIGGVLGSVLGGGNSGGILGSILGGGGLSIGSVITGTIANALGGGSQYGYQDRSNVYFRTDGQRVYEIDARTNQVVRIHPAR